MSSNMASCPVVDRHCPCADFTWEKFMHKLWWLCLGNIRMFTSQKIGRTVFVSLYFDKIFYYANALDGMYVNAHKKWPSHKFLVCTSLLFNKNNPQVAARATRLQWLKIEQKHRMTSSTWLWGCRTKWVIGHRTWSIIGHSTINMRLAPSGLPLRAPSIGTRGHTGERRLQRQQPAPAVMKTSSFPVHLCLTRVAITPLIWGILSWIFSISFITTVPTTYQNMRATFYVHVIIYSCVFDGSIKKSGLFSSRNQGVPQWPTYTWLAKLLMRDRVTSVCVPLYAVENTSETEHTFVFFALISM